MPADPEFDALLSYLKTPADGGPSSAESAQAAAHRLFGSHELRGPRQPFTELQKVLLPKNRRFSAEDAENARRWAIGWEDYGFEPHEVETWLRAGLEPNESEIAAILVGEGITPDRVLEPLTHPETGERLTVLDVARSGPQHWAYDRSKTMCEIFDEAGVERTRGEALLPRFLRAPRRSS